MVTLVLKSWTLLLYFDWLMKFRGFPEVHTAVRTFRLQRKNILATDDRDVSHAVNLACVFYFKPVLCLQRSAATTLLLRHHGRNAEMVIGAQLLPFQSHAWVEIEGRVVNDKPYVREIYEELERC